MPFPVAVRFNDHDTRALGIEHMMLARDVRPSLLARVADPAPLPTCDTQSWLAKYLVTPGAVAVSRG
jgi:hypothetical protein